MKNKCKLWITFFTLTSLRVNEKASGLARPCPCENESRKEQNAGWGWLARRIRKVVTKSHVAVSARRVSSLGHLLDSRNPSGHSSPTTPDGYTLAKTKNNVNPVRSLPFQYCFFNPKNKHFIFVCSVGCEKIPLVAGFFR